MPRNQYPLVVGEGLHAEIILTHMASSVFRTLKTASPLLVSPSDLLDEDKENVNRLTFEYTRDIVMYPSKVDTFKHRVDTGFRPDKFYVDELPFNYSDGGNLFKIKLVKDLKPLKKIDLAKFSTYKIEEPTLLLKSNKMKKIKKDKKIWEK